MVVMIGTGLEVIEARLVLVAADIWAGPVVVVGRIRSNFRPAAVVLMNSVALAAKVVSAPPHLRPRTVALHTQSPPTRRTTSHPTPRTTSHPVPHTTSHPARRTKNPPAHHTKSHLSPQTRFPRTGRGVPKANHTAPAVTVT